MMTKYILIIVCAVMLASTAVWSQERVASSLEQMDKIHGKIRTIGQKLDTLLSLKVELLPKNLQQMFIADWGENLAAPRVLEKYAMLLDFPNFIPPDFVQVEIDFSRKSMYGMDKTQRNSLYLQEEEKWFSFTTYEFAEFIFFLQRHANLGKSEYQLKFLKDYHRLEGLFNKYNYNNMLKIDRDGVKILFEAYEKTEIVKIVTPVVAREFYHYCVSRAKKNFVYDENTYLEDQVKQFQAAWNNLQQKHQPFSQLSDSLRTKRDLDAEMTRSGKYMQEYESLQMQVAKFAKEIEDFEKKNSQKIAALRLPASELSNSINTWLAQYEERRKKYDAYLGECQNLIDSRNQLDEKGRNLESRCRDFKTTSFSLATGTITEETIAAIASKKEQLMAISQVLKTDIQEYEKARTRFDDLSDLSSEGQNIDAHLEKILKEYQAWENAVAASRELAIGFGKHRENFLKLEEQIKAELGKDAWNSLATSFTQRKQIWKNMCETQKQWEILSVKASSDISLPPSQNWNTRIEEIGQSYYNNLAKDNLKALVEFCRANLDTILLSKDYEYFVYYDLYHREDHYDYHGIRFSYSTNFFFSTPLQASLVCEFLNEKYPLASVPLDEKNPILIPSANMFFQEEGKWKCQDSKADATMLTSYGAEQILQWLLSRYQSSTLRLPNREEAQIINSKLGFWVQQDGEWWLKIKTLYEAERSTAAYNIGVVLVIPDSMAIPDSKGK